MRVFLYKGYDIFLETIEHSGAIVATWSNQYGENRDKGVFYDYTDKQIIQEIKGRIDDILDFSVTYYRNPTKSEITWGAGATHYKDFSFNEVVKPNGYPKKWIVCPHDGLRYYR